MTINKFNYEAFALDYLEGTLSPDLVKEMERFLASNPTIEAELFGMMDLITLEADKSIVYEHKTSLLKEEKVVWLSKKWVRSLAIAASFALLIVTYFMGYQAGSNSLEQPIVARHTVEQIASPEKVEPINAKDKKSEQEIVIVTKENKSIPTIQPKLKLPYFNRNNTKHKTSNPLEISITPSIEMVKNEIGKSANEEVLKNNYKEEVSVRNLTPLTTLPVLNAVVSINDSLNDLQKALTMDLTIDKNLLAINPKKKRTIKDLLGKFPIHELKDALIPTYYREDDAGQ